MSVFDLERFIKENVFIKSKKLSVDKVIRHVSWYYHRDLKPECSLDTDATAKFQILGIAVAFKRLFDQTNFDVGAGSLFVPEQARSKTW